MSRVVLDMEKWQSPCRSTPSTVSRVQRDRVLPVQKSSRERKNDRNRHPFIFWAFSRLHPLSRVALDTKKMTKSQPSTWKNDKVPVEGNPYHQKNDKVHVDGDPRHEKMTKSLSRVILIIKNAKVRVEGKSYSKARSREREKMLPTPNSFIAQNKKVKEEKSYS